MMTEEWANGMSQMPLAEAQKVLTQLPEQLAQGKQPLALTRSGDPVLAVLPWSLFESLVETLEIMSDPSLMSAVRDDLNCKDEQPLVSIEQLLADVGNGDKHPRDVQP